MKSMTILSLVVISCLSSMAAAKSNVSSTALNTSTCTEIFKVTDSGESYQKCQGLGDYEIGLWLRHGWTDVEVIYSGTIVRLPAGTPDLFLLDVYGRTNTLEVEWRLNADGSPKALIIARETTSSGQLQTEYHVIELNKNNSRYLGAQPSLAKARKFTGLN